MSAASLLLFVILAAGANRAAARPAAADFSIPVIDLAGQSHRRVVVDREEGFYLWHPTTLLLEDGRTILCVYPQGHGRGAILLKRSDDGGRTWSERLPTPKSWETSLETLPDGTFVVTTYGHWESDRVAFVISVRFTLAELDALASGKGGTDPDE